MSYEKMEKTHFSWTSEMRKETEGIIAGASLIIGGLALMSYADELHSNMASYTGLGINIVGFTHTARHLYHFAKQTLDIF